MITMNPYDAHASSVGPVFNVGNWSSWRCLKLGLIVGIVGIGALLVTVFLYDPKLMLGQPKKEPMKGLVKETVAAQKQHPWGMRAGMGAAALTSWFCLAGATAIFRDMQGNYFLRVGPGGIALRLPCGLDLRQAGFGSKVLDLEVPWQRVLNLTVTSHRRAGSLSRNAGNIGSSIRIQLESGKKYYFDTSMLSLPGYLIRQRIEEAREMVIGNPGFEYQPSEELAAV